MREARGKRGVERAGFDVGEGGQRRERLRHRSGSAIGVGDERLVADLRQPIAAQRLRARQCRVPADGR